MGNARGTKTKGFMEKFTEFTFKLRIYIALLMVLIAFNGAAQVEIYGIPIKGGEFEYDGIKYKCGDYMELVNNGNYSRYISVAGMLSSNKNKSIYFPEFFDITWLQEDWIDVPGMAPMGGVQLWIGVIEDHAFEFKEIESIILPEKIEKIGEYAFMGTALKEVDIPAKVTRIGEGAFKDCVYLETVNLAFGETCGSIAFGETCGSVAFENCTNLKEIIIGNDGSSVPAVISHSRSETDNYVVTFASNTFKGCGSIEKITVHSDVVVEFGEDAFDADVYEKATVYVPDGSVDEFKQSEQWGRFKNIKDLSSSSIEDVATDNINGIVQVYTLSGIEVYSGTWNERPELPKGVYIMHSKNGSSKKIAIR